jgi:hypothetical protein
MKTKVRLGTTAFVVLCVALSGCDDDDDAAGPGRFPYEADKTEVIGGDSRDVHDTPAGDECIELDGVACVKPQDECGDDATADVLLDSNGEVIEIVCLPDEEGVVIIDAEDGEVVLDDDGAVVIVEDEDLDGNVVVEGNSAVIYGDSPEETVIEGNLNLKGNEAIVRGLTVTGDVTFEGNESQFYYCVVHGDVVLKGNKNFVSNCTVFGSIRSSGNEDDVISNLVEGTIELGGAPRECRDNRHFVDENDNNVVDPDELDAATPLDCE